MVTPQEVQAQLNRIGFKMYGWGKAEVRELPHVLLPDEEIYEAVNGFYDGGFALLLATDVRVLLIDKKPFNYLTVEDLRFDMINEIDYSHRMVGAGITIATGSKNLIFHSYNQSRLRKLIGHVQDCMATAKKQQQYRQVDQNQHLEEINQRLQAYLITQHEHQQELEQQLQKSTEGKAIDMPEPPKPDSVLTDYLYAQRLLADYNAKNGSIDIPASVIRSAEVPAEFVDDAEEIRKEGLKEVFGDQGDQGDQNSQQTITSQHADAVENMHFLKIAYSKLPLALRNRRFGRPSFHAHSQADNLQQQVDPTPPQ